MHLIHAQLSIGGMTCIHCQNKIEQALRHTPGVTQASVSYRKGTAAITYDCDRTSLRDLVARIEALDYQVLPQPQHAWAGCGRTAGLLAVIVALYALLQWSGALNLLVPSQLADTKMGYGMLFVVGLITSVHCVAMCGGINLSQCLPQGASAGSGSRLAVFRPALLYNLGRVVSYTAVGFLLGAAGLVLGGGSGTGLPTFLQGLLKLAAGVFMVVMGVNMLGLFPWLRRLQPSLPRALTSRIDAQKAQARGPFFVGLLNGLMPCGPLQSMQLVALATANPLAGALSMLLFSLGTVPLMLGLGSLVSALGRRFSRLVTSVGAVLVVVLGLAMLSQGGSLSGLLPPEHLFRLVLAGCVLGLAASLPFRRAEYRSLALTAAAVLLLTGGMVWGHLSASEPPAEAAAGEAELMDGLQVVNSTLSARRYPSITVQAGTPVRWVIDAPAGSINGCNYRMLLSAYGIEYTFQEGENIIEFNPTEPGTYSYTCWMGMLRGNIFVTEAGAAPSNVPVPAGYQIPSDPLAIAAVGVDEDGSPVQEVSITLTEDGFAPAVVVVQAGLPVLWTIDNRLPGTSLLAPAYSTVLNLAEGENALYLYAAETFDVSTGDNRFYAYIKVVDDLEQADTAAIQAEVDAYKTYIYPASFFESAAAGASCCG